MAKIKYSALVSDMRNKLNGSVMSKNRYGSYVRNKVTPVNPDTDAQQRSRQAFGNLSAAWKNLSGANRRSFTDLANRHPFRDIFGDEKFLDGKAMFIKTNSLLLQLDFPAITSAQMFEELPSLIGSGGVLTGGSSGLTSLTLEGLPETLPSDTVVVLYATPPLPVQINFIKNRLRLVGAVVPDTGVADFTDAYIARFSSSSPSRTRVALRWALLSLTTGQLSVPLSEWVAR